MISIMVYIICMVLTFIGARIYSHLIGGAEEMETDGLIALGWWFIIPILLVIYLANTLDKTIKNWVTK